MGNLTLSIKKFMQNKNTVTVVGAVLAVFILYFAYTMRVKSAINPIPVPYAKETINPGVQITESMIGIREVPPSMLAGEVLQDKAQVIDKYSAVDSVIPAGCLFYARNVVEKEQLPDSIISDYQSGYVLYNLNVDTNSTYGNSVYPGNYIDIWLKAVNKLSDDQIAAGNRDADKIMYGKLISNIKVLAVLDANGQNVFSNMDEVKAPSMIVFALPEEYYVLLSKARYMRTYDTSIELVPTNESLKDEPADLALSSEKLKEWINNHTV